MESESSQPAGDSQPSGGPETDSAADHAVVEARLVSPAVARDELSGPRWLHPSSIAFGVLSAIRQFAVAGLIALFLASRGSELALIAAGVGVCMTAVSAVLRYVTLRYQLVGDELKIDKGLLFRRHRTIPVSRIQNIDLIQNPVHHWLNVAEVRIETAGGSEPEAVLRVLKLDDVELLRAAVFGRSQGNDSVAQGPAAQDSENYGLGEGASGSGQGGPPHTGNEASLQGAGRARNQAQPGTLLHQVTIGQLIRAGLISNRGFVLIPVLLGFFYQFDLDERLDFRQVAEYLPRDWSTSLTVLWSVVGAIVVLFALRLFSIGWFVLRFYGHRLERKGDDLRITCGLFTRVSATVPRPRIQFISVQQTLLGRWAGLSMVRIETAGGAGKPNEDAKASVSRRWFVPVIGSDQVDRLLTELRPGLKFHADQVSWQPTAPGTWRRLLRIAVMQSLAIGAVGGLIWRPWGLLAALPAVLVLGYFARRYARSLKFTTDDSLIAFRSGILTRKTSFTFFDKVQAVSLQQSPFDRRWDMQTLRVDTAAAGPAQHRIEVKFLPSQVALEDAMWISSHASRARLELNG